MTGAEQRFLAAIKLADARVALWAYIEDDADPDEITPIEVTCDEDWGEVEFHRVGDSYHLAYIARFKIRGTWFPPYVSDLWQASQRGLPIDPIIEFPDLFPTFVSLEAATKSIRPSEFPIVASTFDALSQERPELRPHYERAKAAWEASQ